MKSFLLLTAFAWIAFAASLSVPSLRVPQLVHPEWEDYPTNSWASCWHSLFDGFPNDDRAKLGWQGRFAEVAQYAVNFYSTGDEVLELDVDNTIWFGTGAGNLDFGHLSWHKQELFKGRANLTSGLGGTDWSGWRFATTERTMPDMSTQKVRKYDSQTALELPEQTLRESPVFDPYPTSMTNSAIPLLVRGAHLAQGIPALAPPTGRSNLMDVLGENRNCDVNVDDGTGIGVVKPNGWPSRNVYGARWLHSDMKDVAYYFNFKFFEKVVEKGCLK